MDIISGYVEVHIFKRKLSGLEYLMLKRAEEEKVYPGLWQVVTGKIKSPEKAFETAIREMKEETGLDPLRFWTAPKINQFYSAERDAIYIVPVFAAEVNSNENVLLCKEHSEFKWMNPDNARELLPWDEQRKALDIITRYIQKMPDYLDLVEIRVKHNI